MKPCMHCGALLEESAVYCTTCGKDQRFSNDFNYKQQPAKGDDLFLKILCGLTLLGALTGIVSFFMSLRLFNSIAASGVMTIVTISLVITLGKALGAVFMLLKKLAGLYIYTAFAVAGVAVAIWSNLFNGGIGMGAGFAALTWISVLISFLFQAAFVVMYWLPVNKKHLS